MSNNQKPFMSIVVTSYNYQDYIKETLESLINQTYDNFEVIVVDDGSTDNSVNVIKDYARKDSRIKLLQHSNGENRGIAESVRVGVESSKGEYVAFCESDDYWALNHLEEKVKYINKFPEADVIPCLPKMFGVQENVVFYTGVFQELFKVLKSIEKPRNIYFELLQANDIVFATFSIMMIKRSKLMQCDFYPPVMKSAIDIWLWKQLLLNCKTGFVNEELTYWRKHENAYSWENKGEGWDIFWYELNKILNNTFTNRCFLLYVKLIINNCKKLKSFYLGLFSIRNKDDHKILTILGVKIKFKRKQKC